MKKGLALAATALLVLAAPAGVATYTEQEMVDMILDHIRGDTNNPCVVIDQGSRPTTIGELPDYDYWLDPTEAYIYVIVYLPGQTIMAHASTACLNGD